MNPRKSPGEGRARVLLTALRTWATIDRPDNAPTAARIQIRATPDWQYAGTVDITTDQYQRLLRLLRDDLAEHHPGHSSPDRAARVINSLLGELLAAGHGHVTSRDLVAAAARIGRPRTWIATHIAGLIESGRLIETRRAGRWRIA